MRKILILLLSFACCSFSGYAQQPVSNPQSSIMSVRRSGLISHTNNLQHQDDRFEFKRITENRYFLWNADGSFLYIGAIRSEEKAYPNGEGLGMSLVKDPQTGKMEKEYSFCPWKRGSRHGEGIVKHPDGRYERAVWKWNRMTILSDATVSLEEQEEMEEQIKHLEISYKYFYVYPAKQ
jgi:hypothetical protein